MNKRELLDSMITNIEERIPLYTGEEFHNLSYDEKLLFHKEVEEVVTEVMNGLIALEWMV